MRLAWFRAAPPDTSNLLDETAPILHALRRTHQLDIVTAAEAHDFVWRHFRQPYDVCVYESGSTPAHTFMRAYRPHYPGLVAPRGVGVAQPPATVASGFSRKELTLGILDASRTEVIRRALDRARAAGTDAELLSGAPGHVLQQADVIVAVEWPPEAGPPTAALLGMAASRAVIVLEVEATAAWAALDPQTWQPRGFVEGTPIVVSIDPRDEEHSLMLAIRRLAADASLRRALGAAAHAWWRAHATLGHAVEAWERILRETSSIQHAQRPAADHTARVREILEPFGVTVDFLGLRAPGYGLRS